ncbi:hypothetical protein NDR87_03595 [Nocardia sp. CDC159]|uniref:Uncharacterized protein n=1 Tax=Nocardia pulmonis TaxID=2951408 RepID=A0A9X2E2Z3_9NOCA|nr:MULTISPECIES: hypothetical protein [Nocardia]MCM6771900.1 hypothetical protein [Nocardia pulmonis]MCM6785442.1 hypothetical protein [Nocardia sp. CDC159]
MSQAESLLKEAIFMRRKGLVGILAALIIGGWGVTASGAVGDPPDMDVCPNPALPTGDPYCPPPEDEHSDVFPSDGVPDHPPAYDPPFP